LPTVELAKLLDFVATLLAAFAEFAGLFVAVINNPKVADVSGAALFLALFGIAVSYLGALSDINLLDTDR